MNKYLGKLLSSFIFLWVLGTSYAPAQKQVAITIDDLILGGGFISLAHTEQVNQQIINTCNNFEVPAIGFVNEGKLFKEGKERRIQILRDWLDAGLELGNHTYSHPSLSRTPLDEYIADVIKGEKITKELLASKGEEIKYFRHPFLHTGPDSLTKAGFEKFLRENDYQIAPVTIESSDYIFNKIYVRALRENDSVLMKAVGEAYVNYTKDMFSHLENVTEEIFGRSINHVFLCHVNAINAEYLHDIFSYLQSDGYAFITLEEALLDEAYQSRDHYLGTWGISWLYRWDQERTDFWLKSEPEVDQKWLELYNN